MMRNAAAMVADAWEETLRTSPDPMRSSFLAELLGVMPRRSYRARLDAQPINVYGELIPRIDTVRRNLIGLGSVRTRPHIPQ